MIKSFGWQLAVSLRNIQTRHALLCRSLFFFSFPVSFMSFCSSLSFVRLKLFSLMKNQANL